MVLNLSRILQQKADVLQSLRDRTRSYLSKWGYSQKAMAAVVGITETYLNDFLQFYKSGNTGARFCNMQHKGQNIPGQIKLAKYDNGAVNETHAAFSKYNQDRMEA
jgi:hypothetical protein